MITCNPSSLKLVMPSIDLSGGLFVCLFVCFGQVVY